MIKNGKIWDGEKFFFSDLYIENGRLANIANKVEMSADFTYDADGQIVSAGLIDSHLHLRKMSSDGLGVGEWACFPFGVTSAVDAWMEQKDPFGSVGQYVKNPWVCRHLDFGKSFAHRLGRAILAGMEGQNCRRESFF